ncbi:MAG: chitin synthase-domain-containing protein [Benjaminiella poitrasii]|nr:MAG: chitin synthase-domain-containing protein [Benjaminiella poitrasii]
MSVKNDSYLRRPTSRRLIWIYFSRLLTLCIPDFILTYVGGLTSDASRNAWREKIALLFLYFASAAFFCFWLEFLSSYFCDPEKTFEYDEVFRNESRMSAIHGKVVDWRKQTEMNSSMVNWVNKYPHHDISANFPRFMILSRSAEDVVYEDTMINDCIYYQNKSAEADAWLDHVLLSDSGYSYDRKDGLSLCPLPNQLNVTGAPCFYGPEYDVQLDVLPIKGDIQYDPTDVLKLYDALPSPDNSTRQAYVILDGYVLDITRYLSGVTTIIPLSSTHSSRSFALNRMFLPLDLTLFLYINLGKDITDYFEGNITENPTLYRNCLVHLFRKGVAPSHISSDCRRINPVLWATMGLGLLYFFTKMNLVYLSRFSFIQRLVFSPAPEYSLALFRASTYQWPHTILMVPCFAESSEMLKQTLDSLSRSTYDDSKKLLLFVCDGIVTSKNEQRETHSLLLEYLGNSCTEEAPLQSYNSLGQHRKRINYARVYSGFYETGRYRVPYLVIVKVGQSQEQSGYQPHHAPPGNRGKRDSLVLVFGFLERCINLASNRIAPLEYEMFNQCYNVLGIDPRCFKYIMVTDANIQVQNDVVQRLVSRLEQDRNMLAVSGHIRPANPEENLTTMLQIFPVYIAFYSVLAYEACLRSAMTINSGLVMYKIWTENEKYTSQQRLPQNWTHHPTYREPRWPKVSDEIILTNPFQDPNRRHSSSESITTMTTATTTTSHHRTNTTESVSSERRQQQQQQHESMLRLDSRLSLSRQTARTCCVHPTVLRGLATPQGHTMHLQNVLLQGEDRLLSAVLLTSHPQHRLGFEPDAIGYATLPTDFFALQQLQVRCIRAKFHSQLEMRRVAWQLGFTYWLLSTTELLDMIFCMPVVSYLYRILARSIKQYGMAYLIITCSFMALVVLHILFFLLRRQFRYIAWFILYCLASLPLFGIWFPLLAVWQSNDAERWYDVWPTANGARRRLHGTIDPDQYNHHRRSPRRRQSQDEKGVDSHNMHHLSSRQEPQAESDLIVPRLRLAEYEAAEIRRLHLAAEAALDSNFVGFTGFTTENEHDADLLPVATAPYDAILASPPMVQLREGVHSTRIISSVYYQSSSSPDTYHNIWRTNNLSYPNSKGEDESPTSPFGGGKESMMVNPFEDDFQITSLKTSTEEGGSSSSNKQHQTSYSELSYASQQNDINPFSNFKHSHHLDLMDGSTLPSSLNSSGFAKVPKSLLDDHLPRHDPGLTPQHALTLFNNGSHELDQSLDDDALQNRTSTLSISSNTFSIHTNDDMVCTIEPSTHHQLPRHRVIALHQDHLAVSEQTTTMQAHKDEQRHEGRHRAVHKFRQLQQQQQQQQQHQPSQTFNASNSNLRQQYDLGRNTVIANSSTKVSKRLKRAVEGDHIVPTSPS